MPHRHGARQFWDTYTKDLTANDFQRLFSGFVLVNLLVLLEVADRLDLKHDLETARDIQLAMLPHDTFVGGVIEVAGHTRPANTVGGNLYDILPLDDDRVMVVLGDVSGKGSPAALLMALLLAMLRTLAPDDLAPRNSSSASIDSSTSRRRALGSSPSFSRSSTSRPAGSATSTPGRQLRSCAPRAGRPRSSPREALRSGCSTHPPTNRPRLIWGPATCW